MDEEKWIAMCEHKIQKKNQTREFLEQNQAVRKDWSCECGSNLKWYSDRHVTEHRRSRKHQQFLAKHLKEN